jgi:hypothetical protein
VITITFNDQTQSIASVEEFSGLLDQFKNTNQFELWLSIENGPSICMLRSGENAWLMYLQFSGDSGFVSQAKESKPGSASYVLSNGQVDEYPLAWCIYVEQCYKVLAYFFVNEGAKPDWVSWHES